MIRKRVYLIGALSLFTLGYCSGHGCASKTTSSQQPTLPLEQSVATTQPVSLPLPALTSQPLSPEEALFAFFERYKSRFPSAPHPDQYLSHQESKGVFKDCKAGLRQTAGFFHIFYQEVSGEVEHCYYEAKEKLETLVGGK